MPTFVSTCASARIAAAPIGRASAQRGQPDEIFPSFFASIMIANTITSVPIAIEKLRTSSRKIIPSPTANSGAVEVRVDERVGPRNFNPARAKFAETAGLNKPTKTNISIAGSRRYSKFKKNGDTKRYSIADVEMVIAAPLRESICTNPRL